MKFEIEIADMAFGGDGVGRHDGQVVFVPFSAVGERLLVRVIGRKKDFLRAEIEEVLVPAAGRTEPRCPLFGRCGGCQYQHLDYAEQLHIKKGQVSHALRRIGGVGEPCVGEIIPSPEPFGYRNRISVHAIGGKTGFVECDQRSLVDVENCLLASDEVNRKLAELRGRAHGTGHFSLREEALPESGFCQSNRFLIERLRDEVERVFGGGGKLLFEGFCGNGFFTRVLARHFARIEACDTDGRCIKSAPALPNVRWHCEEMETVLANLEPDACLVDPPREGLTASQISLLREKKIGRMVYVSCHPATMARDIGRLCAGVGVGVPFHLESVQPIDLFPQTAHIECISLLVSVG